MTTAVAAAPRVLGAPSTHLPSPSPPPLPAVSPGQHDAADDAALFFVPDDVPSPRGRPQHKASESTNTFLSSPSPSPSPVSRKPRGPQNPVQYAPTRSAEHPLPSPPITSQPADPCSVRAPQPQPQPQPQSQLQSQQQQQQQQQHHHHHQRQERHVARQTSQRSRPQHVPQQPSPSPTTPMALMQPDMTPLSFSRSPKRKRQPSSSQSNICMPKSGDPGCMAVFMGSKQPRRRRSSSVRGRSQTRIEERNSLLADFHGYEREDSPRTTVSKRMSDLGLLDPVPHHKRDASSFSTAGNDVATRAITEEDEPESALGISHNHVASQQALPRIQTFGSQRRQDKQLVYEQDSDRKASETSDQSLSKRSNSARTSYSLFPAPNDSPVSPMSPGTKAFADYPVLRSNSSPKRQESSPSPPLGPRPVSPSRQTSVNGTTNSRKTSAAVPKHARTPSQDVRRRAPSPPLTAGAENPLVWHDSEITGHLMMDPDDDGTGINGVGFKPSKVEEEVRRMKRRQQVEAWKAREGRADRDERMRRRHVGEADPSASTAPGDETKRYVRFAEEL